MIIKGNGFQLEQVRETPFFNLKIDTIINAGKIGKERVESQVVGYGMTFVSCVKQVIAHKLNLLTDKVVSPGGYVSIYSKVVDSTLNSLQITDETVDYEETSEE